MILKLKPRSYLLDLFAIFFGISAWISINGLFVELPLMVQVRLIKKKAILFKFLRVKMDST